MKSGVYRIANTVNGKMYVGSAVNMSRRWSIHRCELNAGRHRNIHLQNAWNKYSPGAFAFEALERIEPERLIEREQAWMDELNVVKTGYNLRPVADSPLGCRHSPETRAKMSAAAKGHEVTPETKAKLSAAAKAQWSLPKTRSEMCAAMSVAKKGKPSSRKGSKHSLETRAKLSAISKGKRHTAKTKAKISAANKGQKRSPEARANMSKAQKARWAVYKTTRAQKKKQEQSNG